MRSLNQDDRETPTPQQAVLTIEDVCIPLFYSATWVITAKINGRKIQCSSESDKEHSKAYIRIWARSFIRAYQLYLSSVGIDVDCEYLKYGGILNDL